VDVIAQSATISPDPLRKVSLSAQTATIRRLRRHCEGITGAEYSIPECQSVRAFRAQSDSAEQQSIRIQSVRAQYTRATERRSAKCQNVNVNVDVKCECKHQNPTLHSTFPFTNTAFSFHTN
jgi:hypothetical protein